MHDLYHLGLIQMEIAFSSSLYSAYIAFLSESSRRYHYLIQINIYNETSMIAINWIECKSGLHSLKSIRYISS